MPSVKPADQSTIASLSAELESLRVLRARDRRALDVLLRISLACRGQTSSQAIFDAVVVELQAIFSLDSCFIAVCDLEHPETFRTALLFDEGMVDYAEQLPFGAFTGQMIRERIPLRIDDLLVARGDADRSKTAFGNLDKPSRAWMGVPLLLGDAAVGVVSIQSYTPAIYTQDDLQLLERIGNVIAVALENANLLDQQHRLRQALEERVSARTEELASLGELATELVLQQPLPHLLDRALRLILPLFGVTAGNVRSYHPDRGILELLAHRGYPPGIEVLPELLVEQSTVGQALLTNRPVVVTEHLPERAPSLVHNAFQSLLSVPLRIGEQVLGTLTLLDAKPHVFDPQQIDLVQVIGNQLALAIENARLLAERDRQIRELRTLGQIGQSASTSLDLRTLLQHVHEELSGLMELEAFVMVVYDPRRQLIIEGLGIDEGVTYDYFPRNQPPPEDSFTAWVLRNRRTLHFNNVAEEIESHPELGRSFSGSGRPSVSWLGVPMFDRHDATLGAIIVQSYRPNTFDERDELFLRNVARQAALHVQNVSLLAQRERQIRELDAIGRIGELVSATFDLDEILRVVYATIQEVTGAPIFYLLLSDPETFIISHAIFIENGVHNDFGWVGQAPIPNSMTDWILQHREMLRYDDLLFYLEQTTVAEVRPNRYGNQERHARSWIGVPLLAKDDEAIGVLSIQDYTPFLYDDQMAEFLSQVASHISLGVQKIKLFEEHERRIRELNAIGRIGELVSASFDIDQMLYGTYEILQEVTSADVFYLVVYERQTWKAMRTFYMEFGVLGDDPWHGGTPPQNSLIGWILRERRSLAFSDTHHEVHRMEELGITPVSISLALYPRSWVGVPLVTENAETIGLISVQHSKPGQYDQQTVDFLGQIASHISLGIQKINLFEARERQVLENKRLLVQEQAHAAEVELQAQQIASVYRISLALSSRIDPQEILELAVRELGKLFVADHVGIVLFDENGEHSRVVAEYPASDALRLELPTTGNPINERLLSLRQPIRIDSVATDPLTVVVREDLAQLRIESLMIVPLVSRDRVFGSIGIDSIGKPRSFLLSEQELFMTVAASVAAAYENARLFVAEQDARRTADTLREVARVLSTSFDVREVLRMILDELHKVIAYDSASVMLLEGDHLRIGAHRGWDDHVPIREQSFLLNEGSAAGLAVRRRTPIVIPDTYDSSFWNPRVFSTQIRSWLGVPLLAKGRVLGVLNIDSYRPSRFTERDTEVAVAFARQAAVALENARLYEESVTRVEQELTIARQIQQNLFPRELPQLPGVELAARCIPARETGGDFFDVIRLHDNRLGLIVGDASGKSIPAAMLMAVARSIARSEATDHETPERVMSETNRWVSEDVPPRSFVALSYATFDSVTRQLALSNAGQCSPLYRTPTSTVDYLDVPGLTLPLGIRQDVEYAALDVQLQSGDVVVFYTDGIVEAHDMHRALFGFDRLEALIRDHGDLSPAALIDLVLSAVMQFCGSVPQHDDMTLLVMRVV